MRYIENGDSYNKCIIWGAGYCGGIALEAYGQDIVLCFADTDIRNIGITRWGKEIISYETMIDYARKYNIRIIAASEDYGEEMKGSLIRDGIRNFDVFHSEYAREIINDRKKGEPVCIRNYYKNVTPLLHPELRQFKNIHLGKRIFLVGNGPSLKARDLDVLCDKQEICFGFNSIHKIFKHTKWRPTYYSIVDYYGFVLNKEAVKSIPGIHFFWDLFECWKEDLAGDSDFFFHYDRDCSYVSYPRFSNDITKGTFLGYSSIYDVGLQFAAYMGASEIYLIGVDHYYPNKDSHEGNHFDGYMDSKEERIVFYPVENTKKGYEREKVENSFRKAEDYSRENGFRIFNATRGGKLEVFERVSFDSLFM